MYLFKNETQIPLRCGLSSITIRRQPLNRTRVLLRKSCSLWAGFQGEKPQPLILTGGSAEAEDEPDDGQCRSSPAWLM